MAKSAEKFNNISLQDIPKVLPLLSLAEQEQLLHQLSHLERLKHREQAQTKFIEFVHTVWPTFISGRHHKIMAEAFERVAKGELKRLIINMPPRHTKSEFASYLLPAWFLGKFPHKKVIQTSHTAELAVGFGRKVRNLVDSDVYKEIFPGLALSSDSKAAGRWNTNKQGDYFAIGVGGAVTGKGADILIIDDPHSEQEAASAETSPEIYDKVYEWYTSGPRQRLQPGGAIVIVMTRWSLRDLTAQVLKAAAQRGGDEWEVIEFPAIMPSGNPLWPEFWSMAELAALKEELPNGKWMAQYQQNPTSDTAAIIKREQWNRWEKDEPPQCEFIVQSWDTAFEANNRSDYSAGTTWGVFFNEEAGAHHVILLNATKDRVEFPKLKSMVLQEYNDYEPDSLIVEKKASGAPLIYELRAMGIPVQEYTPVRGTTNNPNNKMARLNAISDLFASGVVWAPNKSWAEQVIDEVASFPAGEHDDYVDSVIMALMRFRQGGFLRLPSDEKEPDRYFKQRKGGYY
jgi:predicted phage terminase large subunit-like protein